MAQDEGKEKEEFDFTRDGEAVGYVLLPQAVILSRRLGRENDEYYKQRLGWTEVVWTELHSESIGEDYHKVILQFRRPGRKVSEEQTGEEEFLFDSIGTLLDRQVLHWPEGVDTTVASTLSTPLELLTAEPEVDPSQIEDPNRGLPGVPGEFDWLRDDEPLAQRESEPAVSDSHQVGIGDDSRPIEADSIGDTEPLIELQPKAILSEPEITEIAILSALQKGFITTIAGRGVKGYSGDGGVGVNATLNQPRDVAVDLKGNLYIADTGNNRIRKLDMTTGVLTTVAGEGGKGYSGDGGDARLAKLNSPKGIAVAVNGDVFIADTGNRRVRRVDMGTNKISTIGGDGSLERRGDGETTILTSIGAIDGITIDPLGNIFMCSERGGMSSANNRDVVLKISAETGIIGTVAGCWEEGFAGDGGPAIQAKLKDPEDVAVDSDGNLFIADTVNARIRKVDARTQSITTIVGNGRREYAGDGGPAISAVISYPEAIVIDSKDNLWILDGGMDSTSNRRIRKVDCSSGDILTVAGNGKRGYAGDDGPAPLASIFAKGLAVDAFDNLYIADAGNNRVRAVKGT